MMWLKEVTEQLKVYCGLRTILDANVALSHLLHALAEIEELQNEIERLREGIECHVARPGEGTYECDISKPCPACRLRRFEEEVSICKCCHKKVSECYCKTGWPYDKQCSDCRDDWPEGTFRDSYCICKPAEEIKPTPMPEWLEKQFEIVENTVSQWSEEKQKRFANINSEEIYEFAMKRSDEILRGKK